jgi:hypothetical protein
MRNTARLIHSDFSLADRLLAALVWSAAAIAAALTIVTQLRALL